MVHKSGITEDISNEKLQLDYWQSCYIYYQFKEIKSVACSSSKSHQTRIVHWSELCELCVDRTVENLQWQIRNMMWMK